MSYATLPKILSGIAVLLMVALLAWTAWEKQPTTPDAGPPSPHRDAIVFVESIEFDTSTLWKIEVNRLVNEGCSFPELYPAVGGPVAVHDCREGR